MRKKISKKKNKIGRPTKLTKELTAEIVDYLKAGNYFETACVLADVHKSTAYEWIKKGNESKRYNRYVRFRDEVEKAKAWSEARDVIIIGKHAETKWKAASWGLERKYPEKWALFEKRKNQSIIKNDFDVKNFSIKDIE